MWVETKKNNEQLREEVEVAKKELSNTKKKLEEALVVCEHRSLPFLSLYQQSFKPFDQVPCYSAALLSPRPVSFDISTTVNQTTEEEKLSFDSSTTLNQSTGEEKKYHLIFQPH